MCLDSDQGRCDGPSLARQHVVRAAGRARIHGIGRNASAFQGGLEVDGERQQPWAAPDQTHIERPCERQDRGQRLQGDVLKTRNIPRDDSRGMDDDRALIDLVGDAETAAAVLLDLRLRAGGLACEVDGNGVYSAGFCVRSYSGT